ncbi:sporulation protein [Streptomyces sp. NPDC047821]|uniref:sporulation protein n=1 Tax=Streptomyces sp. NPDC047821 TaxID=3365488 RepID=UPI003710E9C8
MAFRTFLSSLGINAPEVETVLDRMNTRPGDRLLARTTLRGGGADVEITHLKLDVVSRFEDTEPNSGWTRPGVITTASPVGPFTLHAGETRLFETDLHLPWEMPLTHALGQPVNGGRAAVHTELAIDGAVDRGDFDEFRVLALPAQDVLLRILREEGFRYDEAEVKRGVAQGADQAVDFWQEFEFWWPAAYGRTGQLEVQFVAREHDLDLHLGTSDRLTFPYAETDAESWRGTVRDHLRAWF